MDTTPADFTAARLREEYAAGTLRPTEVLEAVIDRVEACEDVLNALWVTRFAEARALAAAADARWAAGNPLSALDGVPVTVKENIAVAGVPMPSGHAAGHPPRAGADAPVTARLLEAGAVLFGVTVMPDWGMLSSGVSSRHGITRSPLNPSLTTGGSSAGAGAAAAAGYGPIHIGTDIGGSIRLPCTWLGLAGLKPSYGRVPLDTPYLGRCAGPLARTVSDVRDALRVIAGPDERDYSRLPAPGPDAAPHDPDLDVAALRIGVHVDAGCGTDTDSEVAAAILQAAEVLESAGARVEEIDPFMTPELLRCVDDFWRVRSWADYAALPVTEQAKILPYVATWAQAGADTSAVRLLECYHGIQEVRRRAVASTRAYDFVLSPVSPVAAFPAQWPMPFRDPTAVMGHIGFTMPYNFSEQPAASVNAGYTDDGRTIGLQIAGRRFDDAGVLDLAEYFEQVAGTPAPVRTVG